MAQPATDLDPELENKPFELGRPRALGSWMSARFAAVGILFLIGGLWMLFAVGGVGAAGYSFVASLAYLILSVILS